MFMVYGMGLEFEVKGKGKPKWTLERQVKEECILVGLSMKYAPYQSK